MHVRSIVGQLVPYLKSDSLNDTDSAFKEHVLLDSILFFFLILINLLILRSTSAPQITWESQHHHHHHYLIMAQKRPNIVFIMADDHASKSISCYGAGINHTPNLDRIANEGMLFNHCYVTNSICTPSRAAILCGTHNHVNGVMTLDSKINKHLPNVAKHLKTGGYQTAMVGKWHLGEGKAHEPTGFDYWSVVPGQGEYWDPEFIDATGTERVPGYATDIITDKCIDWMKARDTNKPFFLMCHHKAPHRSWECDDKHRDLYKEPVKLPDTFTDDCKCR
jgi:arylsulfatase A-like enzyme